MAVSPVHSFGLLILFLGVTAMVVSVPTRWTAAIVAKDGRMKDTLGTVIYSLWSADARAPNFMPKSEMSWDDLLTPSDAPACPGSAIPEDHELTLGGRMSVLRIARALALSSLAVYGLHFVLCALYTFGVRPIRRLPRVALLPTMLISMVLMLVAIREWTVFTQYCEQYSLCGGVSAAVHAIETQRLASSPTAAPTEEPVAGNATSNATVAPSPEPEAVVICGPSVGITFAVTSLAALLAGTLTLLTVRRETEWEALQRARYETTRPVPHAAHTNPLPPTAPMPTMVLDTTAATPKAAGYGAA